MSTTAHDVRTRLAHALGYDDYPVNATAEPCLTYIYKRHVGNGTLEDWVELFIDVIQHFNVNAKGSGGGGSIQALIERLAASEFRGLFSDTSVGQTVRLEHIEDTVLYFFGTWTTMLGSFIQQRAWCSKVVAAYRIYSDSTVSAPDPYDNDLIGLLNGCELLPGGRWDRRYELGHDAAKKLMMAVLCGSPNSPASPMHMSLQSRYNPAFGSSSSRSSLGTCQKALSANVVFNRSC